MILHLWPHCCLQLMFYLVARHCWKWSSMLFQFMNTVFTEKGVFSAMIIFLARQSLTINICFTSDPHNKKTSAKTVVVKSISLERDMGITINLIVYSSLYNDSESPTLSQTFPSFFFPLPFHLIKPWTLSRGSSRALYQTNLSYKIVTQC